MCQLIYPKSGSSKCFFLTSEKSGQSTREILCTSHGKGKKHDFRIFSNSQVRLRKDIELLGDKGYQGIGKLHTNSRIPKKGVA